MKKLMSLVWLIAFFTLAGQAVCACSCAEITGSIVLNDNAPEPDPEEVKKWRLEQTESAYFIGSVVKIEKIWVRRFAGDDRSQMKRVTVKVEKYWLGVKTPKMIIYTGVGDGDCGVPYIKGKQYLFTALRGPLSGWLETGICSPSKVNDPLVNAFNEVFGSAKEFL